MKNVSFIILFFSNILFAQNVVIDAGHGWGAPLSGGGCANPDNRLAIEMNTAHSVSLKLKDLIEANCPNLQVLLTRPNNDCNSWVSITNRTAMANSWGADVFLSIHTNAGGGTGTETFWCALSPSNSTQDSNLSDLVQNDMVNYGNWTDRRSVDDITYLSFHLGVLRYSNANGVLNEIGFGDNSNDAVKLNNNFWRDQFALAYFNSIQSFFNISCSVSTTPPVCNNNFPCSPIPPTLTINTSGNCNPTPCSTINATPTSPNIPFRNGSNNVCNTLYQTARHDDDVWFRITPNSNAQLTIRVTPTSNLSNFDPVIGLYQGNCSNPNQVACADVHPSGIQEEIIYTPTAGTTYLVRVFGYSTIAGTSGNFNICVFQNTSSSGCIATSPYPSSDPCYLQVIADDPFCCDTEWDNLCQQVYDDCNCSPPNTPGSISGSTTVCSGTSQTYTINSVSGATSYSWSYSGGGNPTGTGTSVTFSPTSSGVLSVVANNNCGSSNQRTRNITVNPTPNTPGSISGSTTVCSGTSQTYSINPVSGATSYSWSYSGGGNPTGTGTSVTFSPTSSGTLSVVANNNCGSSNQRTRNITVNTTPNTPGSISGSTTVCSGTSQTYSINSVSGATSYTWSYNGATLNSTGTSVTFSPTSTGVLSVVANNNCGSSNQRTRSITVTSAPSTPSITPNNPPAGCNPITLTASSCSGCTYLWNTPSGSLNTGTTNELVASESGNYYVVASIGSCSSSTSSSVNVSISGAPSVSFSGLSSTYCENDNSVTLSGSPTGGVFSGSGVIGNEFNPSNAGVGTHLITYEYEDLSTGCSGSSQQSVQVNPLPNADAGLDQNIEIGQSTTLSGNGNGNCSWSPTNDLSTPNSCVTEASPSVTTTYTLTVSDGSCVNTDQATVFVNNPDCDLILSPSELNVEANASIANVDILIDSPCDWNANVSCNWISIINQNSGQGNYTIELDINQNLSETARTCTLIVNGQELIITQNGESTDPCVPPLQTPTIILNDCELVASFIPEAIVYQWYISGNPIGFNNRFLQLQYSGTYYVEIFDENDCSVQSEDIFINVDNGNCITSISEAESSEIEISLMPNPNEGIFNLVNNGRIVLQDVNISIYDILGKIVYEDKIDNFGLTDNVPLDISYVSSGTYLVNLYNNQSFWSSKIIVNR